MIATPPNGIKSVVCPVCKTAVSTTTCPACQEDLTLLMQVSQMASWQYNQGLQLAAENKKNEAIAAFLTALTLNPHHADTLVVLGKLYAQQQQYDQANACWQQALLLEPDNPKAKAGVRRVHHIKQQTHQRHRLGQGVKWVTAIVVCLTIGVLAFVWGNNQGETAVASQPSPVLTPIATERPFPTPTLTPHTTSAPLPTTNLKQIVQQNLKSHSDLAPFSVQVQQIGNGVALAGSLPTYLLKEQAVTLASQVVGVEWVDAVQLTITPLDLVEAVQTRLQADTQLDGIPIEVEQGETGIYLIGTVPDPELKNHAEGIAISVAGVLWVDSRQLQIVPPSLVEPIQQALLANPQTAQLTILVEQLEGGIRLTGIVPDLGTRTTVDEIVRGVAGVTLVDMSNLRVEITAVPYIVQEGDSLSSIALLIYGDQSQWALLYEANREAIFSAHLLRPGMRLTIPINN